MVLFVNGCVRENSRTLALAEVVLNNLSEEFEEVRLYPDGPTGLDAEKLSLRTELLAKKEYDHPMLRYAGQFAAADTIVMAAPFWDLAFPAKMRAYLEEVTATGITFAYGENGIPHGLCRAKKLIYVTTAGGPIFQDFGFSYVKTLAQTFYGISDVVLVKAEKLDMIGSDPSAILETAKNEAAVLLNTKTEA